MSTERFQQSSLGCAETTHLAYRPAGMLYAGSAMTSLDGTVMNSGFTWHEACIRAGGFAKAYALATLQRGLLCWFPG